MRTVPPPRSPPGRPRARAAPAPGARHSPASLPPPVAFTKQRGRRIPPLPPAPDPRNKSRTMAVPALSILIPTYKRPGMLRQTLESLAGQTFRPENLEIILSDDGSGDETREVV